MKTFRVCYADSAEEIELEQFNDLNEAIKYTKNLLPSKVYLYDGNYFEHSCCWTVEEIIFDKKGKIEDKIDHFISELYYEEDYFRKKFGYPDGVETLNELAEYIKKYGDSDCVDYICEKNGWKYDMQIVTDGEYVVTRELAILNTKISLLDDLKEGNIFKLTDYEHRGGKSSLERIYQSDKGNK